MLYYDCDEGRTRRFYQVVDNALKMGHGGGINGLKKPRFTKATTAEKDAFEVAT